MVQSGFAAEGVSQIRISGSTNIIGFKGMDGASVAAPSVSYSAPTRPLPLPPTAESPDLSHNSPAPPVAQGTSIAQPPGGGFASQRAEAHIRYAFELAQRGAVYSAHAEFIQALKLVSQILDTQEGTQRHGAALTAGLRAFAEAEDFAPEDAHRGAPDLSRISAAHQTPILKNADRQKLTTLIALQCYYTYAKEQLTAAAGHEHAGSLALYGTGRLQAVLGRDLFVPKAIALYQASLLVDPNNYKAANELAVLMARCGEWEESRSLLLHSLKISARPETWYNIAVVCENLGRADEAKAAREHYKEALAAEPDGKHVERITGGMVYWVDKEVFDQTPDPAGLDGPPSAPTRVAKSQPASPPAQNERRAEDPWTSVTNGLKNLGETVGVVPRTNSMK